MATGLRGWNLRSVSPPKRKLWLEEGDRLPFKSTKPHLDDTSIEPHENESKGAHSFVFPDDGVCSPLKWTDMKQYDKRISDLKRENFNLKLRMYFLEEKLEGKFHIGESDLHKLNIQLKTEVKSLKNEVGQKNHLLQQALGTLEKIETTHQQEILNLKNASRKEHAALETQITLLKEKLQKQESTEQGVVSRRSSIQNLDPSAAESTGTALEIEQQKVRTLEEHILTQNTLLHSLRTEASVNEQEILSLKQLLQDRHGALDAIDGAVHTALFKGIMAARLGDKEGIATAKECLKSSLKKALLNYNGDMTTTTTTSVNKEDNFLNEFHSLMGDIKDKERIIDILQKEATKRLGEVNSLQQRAETLQVELSDLQYLHTSTNKTKDDLIRQLQYALRDTEARAQTLISERNKVALEGETTIQGLLNALQQKDTIIQELKKQAKQPTEIKNAEVRDVKKELINHDCRLIFEDQMAIALKEATLRMEKEYNMLGILSNSKGCLSADHNKNINFQVQNFVKGSDAEVLKEKGPWMKFEEILNGLSITNECILRMKSALTYKHKKQYISKLAEIQQQLVKSQAICAFLNQQLAEVTSFLEKILHVNYDESESTNYPTLSVVRFLGKDNCEEQSEEIYSKTKVQELSQNEEDGVALGVPVDSHMDVETHRNFEANSSRILLSDSYVDHVEDSAESCQVKEDSTSAQDNENDRFDQYDDFGEIPSSEETQEWCSPNVDSSKYSCIESCVNFSAPELDASPTKLREYRDGWSSPETFIRLEVSDNDILITRKDRCFTQDTYFCSNPHLPVLPRIRREDIRHIESPIPRFPLSKQASFESVNKALRCGSISDSVVVAHNICDVNVKDSPPRNFLCNIEKYKPEVMPSVICVSYWSSDSEIWSEPDRDVSSQRMGKCVTGVNQNSEASQFSGLCPQNNSSRRKRSQNKHNQTSSDESEGAKAIRKRIIHSAHMSDSLHHRTHKWQQKMESYLRSLEDLNKKLNMENSGHQELTQQVMAHLSLTCSAQEGIWLSDTSSLTEVIKEHIQELCELQKKVEKVVHINKQLQDVLSRKYSGYFQTKNASAHKRRLRSHNSEICNIISKRTVYPHLTTVMRDNHYSTLENSKFLDDNFQQESAVTCCEIKQDISADTLTEDAEHRQEEKNDNDILCELTKETAYVEKDSEEMKLELNNEERNLNREQDDKILMTLKEKWDLQEDNLKLVKKLQEKDSLFLSLVERLQKSEERLLMVEMIIKEKELHQRNVAEKTTQLQVEVNNKMQELKNLQAENINLKNDNKKTKQDQLKTEEMYAEVQNKLHLSMQKLQELEEKCMWLQTKLLEAHNVKNEIFNQNIVLKQQLISQQKNILKDVTQNESEIWTEDITDKNITSKCRKLEKCVAVEETCDQNEASNENMGNTTLHNEFEEVLNHQVKPQTPGQMKRSRSPQVELKNYTDDASSRDSMFSSTTSNSEMFTDQKTTNIVIDQKTIDKFVTNDDTPLPFGAISSSTVDDDNSNMLPLVNKDCTDSSTAQNTFCPDSSTPIPAFSENVTENKHSISKKCTNKTISYSNSSSHLKEFLSHKDNTVDDIDCLYETNHVRDQYKHLYPWSPGWESEPPLHTCHFDTYYSEHSLHTKLVGLSNGGQFSPDLGIESDPNRNSSFPTLETPSSTKEEEKEAQLTNSFPVAKRPFISSASQTPDPLPEKDSESGKEYPLSTPEIYTLYAVGQLKDYEFLKQLIGESLAVVKGMFSRVKNILAVTTNDTPPNKKLDNFALKEISYSCQNLEVYIEKSWNLINCFLITSLSSEDEVNALKTKVHYKPGQHSCQSAMSAALNEFLYEELTATRKDVAAQTKDLQDIMAKLKAAAKEKEDMEETIAYQLNKACHVLQQARGNLNQTTQLRAECTGMV